MIGGGTTNLNISPNQNSQYDYQYAKDAQAFTYVKQGWNEATASVEIPLIASLKSSFSWESLKSHSSETIDVNAVAKQYFSRGTISLVDTNHLQNDVFVNEIKEAVTSLPNKQKTDKEKADNIIKVLNNWGHVFATEIEVGGMRTIESTYSGIQTVRRFSLTTPPPL